MTMKRHTRIDLVEGGNIFKQGEHVKLSYAPRDSNGDTVDLSDKDISVVIWNRKGVMYEGSASYDVDDELIRMMIEETLAHGEFNIEFTATSSTDPSYRQKFPSSEYEGRLLITPSAENMDVVGVQMTTVAQLKADQKADQEVFEAAVIPRVETVENQQAQLAADYQTATAAMTVDSEVVLARKGEPTLGAFNDKVTAQLAEKATQTDLEVERARITSLATLPAGSTTGDAELIDVRIGADGVAYQNAGVAVRSQLNVVNTNLNELQGRVEYTNVAKFNQSYYNFGTALKTNYKYVISIKSATEFVCSRIGIAKGVGVANIVDDLATFVSLKANVAKEFEYVASGDYGTIAIINPDDYALEVKIYSEVIAADSRENLKNINTLSTELNKTTVSGKNLFNFSTQYITSSFVTSNGDGSFTDALDGLGKIFKYKFDKGLYTISLIPVAGQNIDTLYVREFNGTNNKLNLTMRFDTSKEVEFSIRSRGTNAKFYIQITKGVAPSNFSNYVTFKDIKRVKDLEENTLNLRDSGMVILTPQMFGAIGDGVTDDSLAFQKAFDCMENATIFIPSGKYTIANPIKITRNIAIIGDKSTKFRSGSTLLFTGTGTMFTIDSIKCTLENLNIVGMGKTVGTAIYKTHTSVDLTIGLYCDNVNISYFGKGFQLEYMAFMTTLRNCKVMFCGTGFYIHSSTSTILEKCWAGSCDIGYDLKDCTYCNFIGCACDDCDKAFMSLDLLGVTFDGCGGEFSHTSPMFDFKNSVAVLSGCRSHNTRTENRTGVSDVVIPQTAFVSYENSQITMNSCYEYNAERLTSSSVSGVGGLLTINSCHICNEPTTTGDIFGTAYISSLNSNKFYNSMS